MFGIFGRKTTFYEKRLQLNFLSINEATNQPMILAPVWTNVTFFLCPPVTTESTAEWSCYTIFYINNDCKAIPELPFIYHVMFQGTEILKM